MTNQSLNLVVVGARRGKSFIKTARAAGVELAGVCDPSEEALEPWKAESGIKLYRDFEEVLNDSAVDAVCLATPVPLHVPQSVAALEAGFHVLCEVPACGSLEDAEQLLQAVRKSGRTYMMAENYCYRREVLMVQNMVEQGMFGEFTFASGAYLHDCRDLYVDTDGRLTWRGERRRRRFGNTYPTHSMGPVCRWLGINRNDFLARMSSYQSPSKAFFHYLKKNWPDRTEYQEPGYFIGGDTCSSMVQTDSGVVIDIRVDWASARPHDMVRYELQGTKASFLSYEKTPLIWIEGGGMETKTGVATKWEPLEKYAEEFEHPLWREHGEAARGEGHGGGDYFTLREFALAIREGRPPEIDVHDAIAWSLVHPLSEESIRNGNAAVAFPPIGRCGKAST